MKKGTRPFLPGYIRSWSSWRHLFTGDKYIIASVICFLNCISQGDLLCLGIQFLFFFSREDTVFFTKIKRNDYLNIILGRLYSSEIKIKHIVEPIYLKILTHVGFLNQQCEI